MWVIGEKKIIQSKTLKGEGFGSLLCIHAAGVLCWRQGLGRAGRWVKKSSSVKSDKFSWCEVGEELVWRKPYVHTEIVKLYLDVICYFDVWKLLQSEYLHNQH